MATAKYEIRIVVDASGVAGNVNKVHRSLDKVDKKAKQTDKTFRFLKRAMTGLFAIALLKRIITLGDSFIYLQNRIRLAATAVSGLVDVQAELFKLGESTRSQIFALATVYGRLALSSKNLGLSQKDLL